jgi:hypothetical protein
MQCEEFEDRLNAILDERQRPEADVELALHCETCPECRQLASAYARLLDGFYALVTPAAPRDMSARVLADFTVSVSPKRRLSAPSASLAAGALALAAGLLIVVTPLLRNAPQAVSNESRARHSTGSKASADRPGAKAIAEALDVNKLPIVPELLALRTDEDPYAGLAKETGQGLAAVVLYVPGIGGSKGIVDANAEDDPAWVVQVSEGLRPITESVSETVNLLLRALPGADGDSRS